MINHDVFALSLIVGFGAGFLLGRIAHALSRDVRK